MFVIAELVLFSIFIRTRQWEQVFQVGETENCRSLSVFFFGYPGMRLCGQDPVVVPQCFSTATASLYSRDIYSNYLWWRVLFWLTEIHEEFWLTEIHLQFWLTEFQEDIWLKEIHASHITSSIWFFYLGCFDGKHKGHNNKNDSNQWSIRNYRPEIWVGQKNWVIAHFR